VDLPVNAPTILLISHVVPYPPAAGNEIRILSMVKWLKSQGFFIVMLLNHEPLSADRQRALEQVVDAIHFIGDDYGAPFPPIDGGAHRWTILREQLARALPDSFLYTALFGMNKQKKLHSDSVKMYLGSERLVQATKYLCGRYQPFAVIAEYVFAAPCLDVVPRGALKIIDTHDMFSRKKEQVLSYGIEDPLPCSPQEERNYLLKGDLIIAIQSNEARMFRRLVKQRDVITVGIDFGVAAEIDNGQVVAGTILVVGSDNALNQHGLREFLEQAWPTVRAARPDAALRVVGTLGNNIQAADGITPVGWVPSLDEEYRKAAVVINPTLAGTGLKIKSVEALCRGKALVGTPNSVEGIAARGTPPYLVCHDWKAFADGVVRLLASEQERTRLQRLALQFAGENFSTEHIYSSLRPKLLQAVPPGQKRESHPHVKRA
jgi:glycosyltransferase involved in cell wall biosynthesis